MNQMSNEAYKYKIVKINVSSFKKVKSSIAFRQRPTVIEKSDDFHSISEHTQTYPIEETCLFANICFLEGQLRLEHEGCLYMVPTELRLDIYREFRKMHGVDRIYESNVQVLNQKLAHKEISAIVVFDVSNPSAPKCFLSFLQSENGTPILVEIPVNATKE